MQQIIHIQWTTAGIRQKSFVFSEQPVKSIGFTAYANVERNYQPYQQVVFDTALENEGYAYQPASSIFICPLGGLYVFTTSICSNASYFSVDIVKESQRLLTARAHGSHDDQGMVSVVTRCGEAERVWVQVNARTGTAISNDTERYVTFSGFLINY